MRLGIFIGDASGLRTDVEALLANAREAERLGFATGWLPHIPWSLDALIAVALAGQVTSRIELGTAVVPTYPRHPITMAQQALSAQAARRRAGGARHRAVASGGHRGDARPRLHQARRVTPREYVEVLKAAFHGTGHVSASGGVLPDRGHARGARAAATCRCSSRRWPPRCCGWPAPSPTAPSRTGPMSGRSPSTWSPRSAAAAASAGRPAPRVVAGIPVAVVRDVDAAKERAAKLFAGYNGIPAYQRIRGEGGDAELPDIAIIGDEKTVRGPAAVLSPTPGATDLAAAVIGLDDDREASSSAHDAGAALT